MNIRFITSLMLLILPFFSSEAAAVTRTWDGGGATNDWSEAANWSGNLVPTASDDVIFDGTSTKNCTVDVTITNLESISLNAGYSGTVSMASGVDATFNGGTIASGAFTANNGTVSFPGNALLVSGGTYNAGAGLSNPRIYTQSGGVFNGSNGIVSSAFFTVTAGQFNAPTGTLSFSNNVTVSGGTFNSNNGTIELIGPFNFTMSGLTVNNLILNQSDGAGVSVSGTMSVLGALTLTEGLVNFGVIRAQNAVSVAPAFGQQTGTQGGGHGTLLIQDGSGPRTISFPAGARFPKIQLNDANATINTSGTGSVITQDFTLDTGSVELGSNTLSVGNLQGGGDLAFIQNGGSISVQTGVFTNNIGNFGPVNINGGIFNGGSGAVSMEGTAFINSGIFAASSGDTFFKRGLTVLAPATFNHNGGTVTLGVNGLPTINLILPAGGTSFNNLVSNVTVTRSGGNAIVNGTFTHQSGEINGGQLELKGNVLVQNTALGGTSSILFSGSAAQNYTNNGGPNTTGTWTLNKPSGAVTAATDLLLATSQALDITSGTLYLADGSDLTVGPVTLGSAGRLINDSSSTVTLGGDLVNNGVVSMFGGGATCPQADSIIIRSSSNGIARNWSGTGIFAVVDANVRDMAGTAVITVYSGTNTGGNGANWTFDPGCAPVVSISPQILSLYRNQTQTFSSGGGFGVKTFSIFVNNSGGTINPSTGFYTPGNTFNVTDTIRATDIFGEFAAAEVTVFPGPPAKLGMVTQPTTTLAGASITPSIQIAVQDTNGTTVPNATNAVTLSISNNPGGSTLSGTLTRNAVNGIATFDNISLNRTGSNYTLAVSSSGLTGTTTSGFSINPGPPTQLAFGVQPSDTEAASIIAPPITVVVQDSSGNIVPTASNQITLAIGTNPAGGILTGTLVRAAISGTATFDNLLINNFADGYTLTANANGLTGATSSPFNILSPFVVRNTNNSGPGSLQNAITKANQTAGQQTISFNIPGPGPFTIAPLSSGRSIHDPVVIDGTTQPGFTGTPLIELSGQSQSSSYSFGLIVASSNVTVKGLVINRFNGEGIRAGIGGPVFDGIVITGNYIGTDVSGNTALGNGTGIHVIGSGTVIGGSAPSERNIISGNTNSGIFLSNIANLSIKGNYIGVGADGITPLGNGYFGIFADSPNTTIGGIISGEANVVANHQFAGITLSFTARRWSIRGNSIYSNGGLGIALNNLGVTQNDPGDPDSGANDLQNFPVITFATGGGTTRVQGTLNSKPSENFDIDFYSNQDCDASGYGEGKTYIGSTNVTTNPSNLAEFDVLLPTGTPIGQFITSTATDSQGNTSGFSQCREATPSSVSISGRIADASNVPIPNARVRLTGARAQSTLTNSNGEYSFRRIPSAANYTVIPTKVNLDFTPTTRQYTNLPSDQTGQDFTGTKTRSTISGVVQGLVNGSPMSLSGVTVTLSGAASRSSVANGSYSFDDLQPGIYTVTAIKDGWTFNPLSIDVTLTTSDQSLKHLATNTTPLEGRIFWSDQFPRAVNANGTADVRLNGRRIRGGLDASPDGKKLAYIVQSHFDPTGLDSLYTANSDGTGESLIQSATSPDTSLIDPEFSPDGSKIAYVFISRTTGFLSSIRITDLVALTTTTVSTGSLSYIQQPGWISPTRLAFSAFDGNDNEIYAVNTDGTGLVGLTDNAGFDGSPTVSYDGSGIAYSSFEFGANSIAVMNADGSNKVSLRNDSNSSVAWSPDGTMLAMERIIPAVGIRISIINSSTGLLIADLHLNNYGAGHRLDWAPDLEVATPAGTNVPIDAGGVDITFSGVSTSGTTTVTRIPPPSAGTAPNGFVIGGIAYEITTTAAYTAPVTVCFSVPTFTAPTLAAFDALSLMHNEAGVLVDRTISRDFPTRTICGSVTTLSPFVLAEEVDDLLPSITGYVEDSNGVPLSDVAIQLSGAEDRFTQTDINGFFIFVNLIEDESYSVQPKQLGYLFNEYSQDFFALTGENAVVFTGSELTFEISGRVADINGNGIVGVTVELEGDAPATTVTDINGDYAFAQLPADGSFSVLPFGSGFSYSPAVQTINGLTNDVGGVDFVQFTPAAELIFEDGFE